ncbi:hypothetical protein AB0E44_09340 [Micrococcus terreus]|uniref:hypothetical protein n=1 Tax=Micrococcus terreus TaxID=574650 RepID=UPI00340F9C7B
MLEQVPDALETVQDTVARLDRVGAKIATRGTQQTIPLNLEAAERATDLHEKLVSWSRLVLEFDNRTDLSNVEPSVYLRMSLPIIQGQDFAGDLHAELRDGLERVLRAIDLPPDIRTIGGCWMRDEATGEACPGWIKARGNNPYARCDTCGETYEADALRSHLVDRGWEKKAKLRTVVLALKIAGVKIGRSTVEGWVKDGKLETHWRDTDGTPLYTMAQVLEMQAKQNEQKKGRPRRVA